MKREPATLKLPEEELVKPGSEKWPQKLLEPANQRRWNRWRDVTRHSSRPWRLIITVNIVRCYYWSERKTSPSALHLFVLRQCLASSGWEGQSSNLARDVSRRASSHPSQEKTKFWKTGEQSLTSVLENTLEGKGKEREGGQGSDSKRSNVQRWTVLHSASSSGLVSPPHLSLLHLSLISPARHS